MADSTRKTANLFDKSTITTGKYATIYGTTANNSYNCSDFIPITDTTYYFQNVVGNDYQVSVVIYNANKQGLRYANIRGSDKASGAITFQSGDAYIRVNCYYQTDIDTVMINEGSTPLPYEPYGWVHSLRKLGTATDTLTTLPADLYADGNNATVGLKGQMEQTGTPSPDSPIQPSECGERTGNLLNPSDILPDTMFNVNADPPAFVYSDTFNCSNYIPVTSGTYLRMLNNVSIGNFFFEFDANKNFLRQKSPGEGVPMPISNDASYITFNISKTYDINKYMFARTSTPLPYEPYGYKIPISSASTATPVYLGEVQTTRKIKRLVLTGSETFFKDKERTDSWRFYSNSLVSAYYNVSMCSHFVYIGTSGVNDTDDIGFSLFSASQFGCRCPKSVANTVNEFKAWLAAQYANDTPVTVWYVLATEETGTVNEPIRKIGDYADTVSGISIPTITGKDTVDVQTTLKPSEVELTYTGWHDANVKEWDGSEWT